MRRIDSADYRGRLCLGPGAVILLIWALTLFGARASVVSEAFVEAVAQLESCGGRYLVGDGGRANGAWHMHEAAWRDTTAERKQKGLPVWNYSSARDKEVAREYARDYLKLLERQLQNELGPNVTMELVYACYNVGFTRFQARSFRVERSPATTRAACARLVHLINALEAAARQNLAMAEVK